MADLLMDWMNQDLRLSLPVNSLESDLSNGYLLGELLWRHNQLKAVDALRPAHNADAQINNFCLVEPVLRAMGIKFDAQMAYAIMKGRPGAAATVFYKVKMVLDRLKAYTTKAGGAPVSVYEPGEGGVMPLPNMPVRLSKPGFDAASQQLFEQAIRQLVDNPTEAILHAHLAPFREAGQRFSEQVERGQQEDAAAANAADAASRAARLYEQEQNRSFMEAYEQRGLEIWMSNQERAKARLQVKRNVEVKMEAARTNRQDKVRAEAASQVTDGIETFEAKLALIEYAAADEPRDPKEAAQEADAAYDSGARAAAAQERLMAMRATKREKEEGAAVRERRRRRFLTEREEAQVSEYHMRAAKHLQDQLSRASIAEAAMEDTLKLVAQHRPMMAENRRWRSNAVRARGLVDLEEALKRDNAHLDDARSMYARELEAQATRYGMSLQAKACAQRARHRDLCREVVHRTVDLALNVVAYRRFATPPLPAPIVHTAGLAIAATAGGGDDEGASSAATLKGAGASTVGGLLIPPQEWKDMTTVFVSSLPLIELDGEEKTPEGASSSSRLEGEEAAEAGPPPRRYMWGRTSTLKQPAQQQELALTESVAPTPSSSPPSSPSVSSRGAAAVSSDASLELAATTTNDDGAPRQEQPQVPSPAADFLDAAELAEYLSNAGEWRHEGLAQAESAARSLVTPPQEGGGEEGSRDKADEEEGNNQGAAPRDASPPSSPPPFYALGEIVVAARLAKDPLAPPPPPPKVPSFELRLVFVGKSFSGKSEQAYLVADRFRLKTLSAENTLREAISAHLDLKKGRISDEELADMPPVSRELLSLGQVAHRALLKGESVPDALYASLVLCAIKQLHEENAALLKDGRPAWFGWTLEDYPQTANQAKCLEATLTGYDDEKEQQQQQQLHTSASSLSSNYASPLAPVRAPQVLTPRERLAGKSGVDLVFLMDADRETVLRRSLGRRIDPETDQAYHLDTNRPPYDLICKERLIAPTDAANPSEALALQLASHDLSVDPLLQLLRRFGSLKVVDSSALSTQGVFAQCVHLISDFLETKAARAAAIAAIAAAEEEAAGAPSSAALDPEKEEGDESGEGGGEEDAQPFAPLVAQSPKAVPSLVPSLGSLLATLWNSMEAQYTSGAKQVFRALRQERLLTTSWLKQQRATFTDYLQRPDTDRPAICSAFLAAFNGIPLELRELATAELQARCEELRWALWAGEEAREAAGVARLESIISDGWLASRVKALERCYAMLLQLELVRFTTSLHLLMDYAAAMQGSGVLPEGLLTPLAENANSEAPADARGKGGGKDKGGKADGSAALTPPVRPLVPAICTAPAFAPDSEDNTDAAPAAAPSKKGGKGGGAPAAKNEAPGGESMSPLEQCLASALAFVTPWQQERFPVLENPTRTSTSVDDNDSEPPPPPASMHLAIWSEAALCEARLKRCASKGAEAVAMLQAAVSHAHGEMGQWVCNRTEEELLAGEALVTIAEEACASGLPLPDDWQLEGSTLTKGPLMLVAPPLPPPVPKVLPQHPTNFNAHQSSLLTKGLAAAAAALGFNNDDDAASPNLLSSLQDRPLSPPTGNSNVAATSSSAGGFVSCDALVELLLRLAASDGDLPSEWCGGPARDTFAEVVAALDPEDSGFVAVGHVLRFFGVVV